MSELIIQHQLIASILLMVTILLARWLGIYYLQKLLTGKDESPRRWINSIKNIANFLIVIGLIIIWLSELRFVALSIATFVVALVIATREFIQCFLGSLYQAGTRAFTIGDWVKIGNHCGEVVRSDWLSTTLMEIDMATLSYSYTGKTIVIPNSQFVVNPIENLNVMRHYVAHSFSITRNADFINVYDAKTHIMNKVNEYCVDFQDVAIRYNALMEKRMGVSLPGPEPSVRVTTTNIGANMFTVTIFCPTSEAVNIEQQITEDFMGYWYMALENSRNAAVIK